MILLNFTPVRRDTFRQGLPTRGIWREVFNSDAPAFGGTGAVNTADLRTEDVPMHGQAQSTLLTLPPLGAVFLRCVRKIPTGRRKKRSGKDGSNESKTDF